MEFGTVLYEITERVANITLNRPERYNAISETMPEDIALCCDMIIMNEKARIGYPPARVWGCPTTAMWVYRLGAEKAKKMLFSGDLITGAEEVGFKQAVAERDSGNPIPGSKE